MKKILALLLISFSLLFGRVTDEVAVDKHYKQLYKLDSKQKEVMFASYEVGKKYDLGYTLVAIAWNESNLGEKNVNKTDGRYGSYGPYHALMDTVLSKYGLRGTKHTRDVIAERLKTDFEFSSNEVIAELKYWKERWKHHPDQYDRMIASYNAGTKGLNSTAGIRYRDVTVNRVKAIERYMKKHQKEYIAYLDSKHKKPAHYASNTVIAKPNLKVASIKNNENLTMDFKTTIASSATPLVSGAYGKPTLLAVMTKPVIETLTLKLTVRT